jgi:hypothetical protein
MWCRNLLQFKLLKGNFFIMRTFRLLATLIAMVASAPTIAQTPGTWLMYFGKHALGSNQLWHLHSEVQIREHLLATTHDQVLLRVGLLREVANNTLIGGGYGYILFYENENSWSAVRKAEHRIWGQYLNTQKSANSLFETRIRSELRFGDGLTPFRNRTRVRYQYVFPKGLCPERRLFLNFYNELFLNHNTQQLSTFDRNRVYGAIGFKVNAHFLAEVGWLRQDVAKSGFNQFFQIGVQWF